MKKFLILSLVPLLLTACDTQNTNEQTGTVDETVTVATSFYPLTFVAEQIGQGLIDVYQVSTLGADPHTFEPTPQQLQRVYDADVLVFNGQGQDTWADRIYDELEHQDTRVLIATQLVELMGYDDDHDDHEEEHDDHEDEHHDDHEGHDDEHDHDHGEWDPHVWLDPTLVRQIGAAVAAELANLDPANASAYQANQQAFATALNQLDTEMRTGLSDCQHDDVIVSHDAFRYLANRYDFNTLEIAGLSPNAEPSPARLAELSELAQELGIRHVFFETHVSSALSDTLAEEIGAETLVLHSLEARTQDERAAGKTYFDLMRQNLAHLRTALECS